MSSTTRIDELWKKFEENPRRFFAPLANEHRKAGDLVQAIAICRQHLPDQPGHISGHIVLAQALLENQELPESSNAFQAALALDPENLIALRCMGDIARQVGDPDTARLWYERVLDVDPRNEEVNTLIREIDAKPVAEPDHDAGEQFQHVDSPADEPLATASDQSIESASAVHDELRPAAEFQFAEAEAHVEVEASADTDADEGPLLDFEPASQDVAGDQGSVSDEARANGAPAIVAPLFEMEDDPASAGFETEVSDESIVEAPDGSLPEPISASAHEVAPEFEAWAFDEPETLVSFDNEPSDASSAADGDAGHSPAAAEPVETSRDEWPSFEASPPEAEVPVERESVAPVHEGWPEEEEPDAGPQPAAASTDADDSWFAPDEVSPEAEPGEEIAGIETLEFSSGVDASAGANIDGFMLEERPGFYLTPAAGSAAIAAAFDDVSDDADVMAIAAAFDDVSDDADVMASGSAADESLDADVMASGSAADEWDDAELEAGGDTVVGAGEIDAAVGEEISPVPVAAIVPQRPTPSAPMEQVTPAAMGFVTETMAELYLQQGYRDEALAVYRELLSQHPGDAALRERVAHLEAGDASSVSIESLSTPPVAGPSARMFFSGVARHPAPARSHAPAPLQPRRATPTVLTSLPASALAGEALDASASDAAARGSLDALFGRTPVDRGSERAAETLASAFEPGAPAHGEPTRAAASELSLDSVFGGTPPAVPAVNGSSDFSFDQFFASKDRDDAVASASRSAPGVEQPNDIEQFTAWLEGLKRK